MGFAAVFVSGGPTARSHVGNDLVTLHAWRCGHIGPLLGNVFRYRKRDWRGGRRSHTLRAGSRRRMSLCERSRGTHQGRFRRTRKTRSAILRARRFASSSVNG
jgi:hypothetical protein